MNSSWSVATLTRNTKADFCRYVAWYLEQGASQLHLYFHNPEDPNIALVEGHDRIDAVRLTPQLMEALGIQNENHGQMQITIGPHAYRRTGADWMLRCDIDELLYFADGQKLADLLAVIQPDEVDTIRLDMAEVLSGGSEGSPLRFRKEMAEADLAKVYGDIGNLLASRHGLLGHLRGKAISRCGVSDLVVHMHGTRFTDRTKRPRGLAAKHVAPVRLLHFNHSNYKDWIGSLGYRLDFSSFDPALAARLKELHEIGDLGAPEIHRIYCSICEFDDDRFLQLKQLGYGFEVTTDIDALVSKYFPEGGRLR